jgi:acylphosphatase
MPVVRARLLISGRVQGVFYRAFTEQVAASMGLGGWVRNLPDGRVEAVMEGEKADIGRAVTSCYEGPPSSRVDDIQITWEEPTGEFSGFSVRY